MRTHKGMRPHDIVILLKIVILESREWMMKDLSLELFISTSEISESLERSVIAGLLDPSKKKVFRRSLMDFLVYGLRHVFPAVPGALTKGLPTAHSSPLLTKYFASAEHYVWPDADGWERGQAIEPFYPGLTKAVRKDQKLYDLVALCDTLRIGKTREIKIAKELLDKTLREKNVPGK